MSDGRSFTRAVILLKQAPSGGCYPVSIEPTEFLAEHDFQAITLNAFPHYPCKRSFIYAFTFQDYMCYVWTFPVVGDGARSIVIVGNVLVPRLFLNFMNDMSQSIKLQKREIAPEILMTLLTSTIASWSFVGRHEALVQFSQGPFRINLKEYGYRYTGYKPYRYLSLHFNFCDLWRVLSANGRVLILGDDRRPSEMTAAVLGVCSLCKAIDFHENVLIMVNQEDYRNGEDVSKFKIVATTSRLISTRSQGRFHTHVVVSDGLNTDNDEWEPHIDLRNKNLRAILKQLHRRNQEGDPYCDFLGKPFVTCDLGRYLTKSAIRTSLSPDQLQALQTTNSWKVWKDKHLLKGDFREQFISRTAGEILADKTEDELIICDKALDRISAEFSRDQHMMSVVSRHRKVIKSRLEQLRT